MPLRNAIQIQTDVEFIYAYEPTYGLNSAHPAAIDTDHTLYNMDKSDAELLARTIAPSLFDTPSRLQEIYDDLHETETSYSNELAASVDGAWVVDDVQGSMGSLLSSLRNTLRQLKELLPDE